MTTATLNEALESLLYRKAAREALFRGDLGVFNLSPGDTEALGAIDGEQLVAAARAAREHVMTRSHRGAGSLVLSFRDTINAWRSSHPGQPFDDLASDFVASTHFAAHRVHACSGVGPAVEVAFFHFAEDEQIGSVGVRVRECGLALLRALALTPEPQFELPTFLRRAPRGFFAVLPDGPELVAIIDGRWMRGPISPLTASILTSDAATDADEAQAVVREELARMGLLAV